MSDLLLNLNCYCDLIEKKAKCGRDLNYIISVSKKYNIKKKLEDSYKIVDRKSTRLNSSHT